MNTLFALLKKYNCIDIKVESRGSITLTVTGSYDNEEIVDKALPFSDFVYIDDFPPLMDAINEFASSSRQRMYTHFRTVDGNELHWAYMCCSKNGSSYNFDGVLLDVYEYLDSMKTDNVIAEFARTQENKISDLNNNSASLEEICGIDYLKKIQRAFSNEKGLISAIFDEKNNIICTNDEFDHFDKFKHSLSFPIKFDFKVGAYWKIASDSSSAVKKAEPYLKSMAENLSMIAHSYIALYNEAENANSIKRQLGANVEQQMLINSMQSIIMEEAKAGDALDRVLKMAREYLKLDCIYAFDEDDSGVAENFCFCGKEDKRVIDYVTGSYNNIVDLMNFTDNYFSNETGYKYPQFDIGAFAVSKIIDNDGGRGLLIYVINGDERKWNYNNRKIIRSVSQVLSAIIFRCKSERKIEEKNKQLYNLAFFDTMLGIKNRSKLDIDVAEELHLGRSGAVLAVQILNTRFLNEVFGQRYTDKLLKAVVESLSVPDIGGEYVYRYSGSIMMIVIRDCTAERAQEITKAILGRFREPFVIDDIEQYAESAIGIAVYNDSVSVSEDLYRAATLSLYRANEYGKNTFAFYSQEFLNAKGVAFNLESELRRCIADNMRNFEITYQPVYDSEYNIRHYETLLRWKSEEMGYISPKVFMRLMEKVGLDASIDLWVIPRACSFCSKIRQLTGKDIKISVNLTTHEMQTGALPQKIHNALSASGLDGSSLIVEVPESAHVLSYNDTASTLGKLKKLGVNICIDSFGNEYLPLHVLKNSYIDMIKVSSSFVTNSGGDFDDVLLSTTFSLAASRGISVCVKNIEYKIQCDSAKQAGADFIQGGFLAFPSSADDIFGKVTANT